ncbi:zinc ABC transporter substrate-binding protein [Alphaproteobacteria bacterium]|nr:zinc ABC transporter substrate-binding protein [Alphaproteobacteria bacterium]MDC1120802.1 zinc ABC transporter substrate-binding protein [Alphaproteobacteria bacterium]
MNLKKIVIAIGAISLTNISAAKADIEVVTSIKPVHSLVSGVMAGVGNPSVIIEGAGSPHTYSLKPSQAKQLQDAKLVFWMGDELETFLVGPIENIAQSATIIKLIDADDLKKIKFREGGMFDDHDDHGDHDYHGHGEHAFEWAGLFDLKAGSYKWSFAKVDGYYADLAMKMVILKSGGIDASEELAEKLLESSTSEDRKNDDVLSAAEVAYSLNFDDSKNVTGFNVKIESDGTYAFFTEHMPFEFEAKEHFFKNKSGEDIEPLAQVPDVDHHEHDHEKHAKEERDEHDHEKHAKKEHDDHGDHDGHDDHGHGEFNPHVWLDPVNAKAIVHEIEEALVKADPEHASKYEANAQKMMDKLDSLVVELRAELEPVHDKGFIVFHDAYQYFEQRFDVAAIGSISVSPEVMPGAERVSELRKKISDLIATCVFSEPQFEPKLVETLVEGTGARTGVLDPLGASLTKGPDLYFELLRNMASSLKKCLSGES